MRTPEQEAAMAFIEGGPPGVPGDGIAHGRVLAALIRQLEAEYKNLACIYEQVCAHRGALADERNKLLERVAELEAQNQERVAQLIAHRACCGNEHDGISKFHGYCVVCGVPWPCEYAGTPPTVLAKHDKEAT